MRRTSHSPPKCNRDSSVKQSIFAAGRGHLEEDSARTHARMGMLGVLLTVGEQMHDSPYPLALARTAGRRSCALALEKVGACARYTQVFVPFATSARFLPTLCDSLPLSSARPLHALLTSA